MLKTTNYKLNKIELTDSPPDITVINPNWDTIDSKLKTVENLTSSIKTKVDTIQNGAEVNVQSDWTVTNSASDAFIKNKPTSLPANGGNADTVDGKHASEFATAKQGTKADNALPKSSYTASDILTKLKTVDGIGSEIDADLLDGKHATDFIASFPKINTDVDFDTLNQAGYYNVEKAANSFTKELHQPVGAYEWGTLLVVKTREYAKLQLYFSHRNQVYYRSGYGTSYNIDWKNLCNADTLCGKNANDFSQGFYRKYTFIGNKQNWYRIAKTDFSAAGIFNIKADLPNYNSNTIFAVSSHRSQNIATITKLAHSSFNTLITAIRLVSKYENLTEQYLDVYIGENIPANTNIEFEVYFSGFNWQSIKPVSSNVPDGYATSVLNL